MDLPFARIGVGICYDIRFPEMALLYAKEGAQLLLYPGRKFIFTVVGFMSYWYSEIGTMVCIVETIFN